MKVLSQVLVRTGPYALTPNTVELIPTLGALSPRGGPVQDPVLTVRAHRFRANMEQHDSFGRRWPEKWLKPRPEWVYASVGADLRIGL